MRLICLYLIVHRAGILADLGFTGMDQVPCSIWRQSSPLGDDWLLRLSIDS